MAPLARGEYDGFHQGGDRGDAERRYRGLTAGAPSARQKRRVLVPARYVLAISTSSRLVSRFKLLHR
jgi:hypothetical protein